MSFIIIIILLMIIIIFQVTGWGYTLANKSPSDELKELVVPYKDDATCRKELPPEFFRFATIDKFCAGHYNKSKSIFHTIEISSCYS